MRITGNGAEEDVDSNIVLGGWVTVVWHTMPAFAYPAVALPSIFVIRFFRHDEISIGYERWGLLDRFYLASYEDPGW